MGILEKFLPRQDRYAALLLYGMVFSTCFNGYDAGIMTVILADKQFQQYYQLDSDRSGTIAVIPWASTALAQLWAGGTLASMVGRLWALRISISVMIVGVVVQVVPNTYGVLIFGRLITGLGFGCVYIATNLYVAECAPRSLRGSFVGTVSQFGYQLGTLIAFWAGYGMSYHTNPFNIAWRVSNLIQVPVGICFVILSFWYPESPRFLLEKYPDDPDRVLRTLARLRSGTRESEHVQLEFHELVAAHEYRKQFDSGYRAIFCNPGMRKRLCYGFYAMALQQIGGIAALTMYATLIYQSLGWDAGSQALALNGIQAALQLVIVLVNTFTVERFGRKGLLTTGFSIQSLALLVCASLTTAFPNNGNKAAAIAEVAMLFIVGLTYCWSNGPIAPTVASEIFPQNVRDKAFGISALGQTICLIALTQPWPRFNNEVGGKSYWLLFALNVAALVSVTFILPETKSISLERMDKLFGEVDAVAAGEESTATEKVEMSAYQHTQDADLIKQNGTEQIEEVAAQSERKTSPA
ncbi:MFS sugar transporter-like protein [Polychaeton citri CBS 116435]|uniref:MFS sugar transporter-like protein n=1 Tax=Polychaeton citri CBS 116435 TaxID=1314669 RepID=A0A9P4Q3F6_9PEZI|nr:MFS sugar transporter-like protein [Polychaeton citri CBS 116435]